MRRRRDRRHQPVWLYQIWAFILPGLHPSERKWTRVFVAIAGPLFLVGVVLGYYTLPKGLEVLIGFNPDGAHQPGRVQRVPHASSAAPCWSSASPSRSRCSWSCSTWPASSPARRWARYRPWIIVGTFVFAAVATPSTDPFTMTFMAVPMVVLFLISEVIARLQRPAPRPQRDTVADLSADDEASPL